MDIDENETQTEGETMNEQELIRKLRNAGCTVKVEVNEVAEEKDDGGYTGRILKTRTVWASLPQVTRRVALTDDVDEVVAGMAKEASQKAARTARYDAAQCTMGL